MSIRPFMSGEEQRPPHTRLLGTRRDAHEVDVHRVTKTVRSPRSGAEPSEERQELCSSYQRISFFPEQISRLSRAIPWFPGAYARGISAVRPAPSSWRNSSDQTMLEWREVGLLTILRM